MARQKDDLFDHYLQYLKVELLKKEIKSNTTLSNRLVDIANKIDIDNFMKEFTSMTGETLRFTKKGSSKTIIVHLKEQLKASFSEDNNNYMWGGILSDKKNINRVRADFIAKCFKLLYFDEWCDEYRREQDPTSVNSINIQNVKVTTRRDLVQIYSEENSDQGEHQISNNNSLSAQMNMSKKLQKIPESGSVIFLNSKARVVESGSNRMIFIGRKKELEEMDTLIKGNNNIVVTGVRGIGKSSFVHHYVAGKNDQFSHIIYASVKNGIVSEAVIEAFKECGDSIGFYPQKGGDYPDSSDLLMLLFDRLKRIKIARGLLILDNANGLASLTHFMNLWNKHIDKGWYIIATTFLTEINLPKTKILPLPAMDRIFAGVLYDTIVLRTQDPDLKKAALEILKTYDYNPLLCELVTKLIQANARIKSPDQLTPSGVINKNAEQPYTLNPLIDSRYASNEEFTIVQYISALFKDVLPGLNEREKALLRFLSIVPKENGGVEQLRLILPLNEHDPDLIDGLARKGWLISNENNSTIMPELYQMAMQNLLQPDVINCQELLDKLKKQLQLNELGNMDKTIYDAEMENAIKHAQSICNNLIYEGVNIDFQVDSLLTIILKILQSPVPDKETAIKKNYCATYAQVLFNLSIALTEKNEKNEALQLAVDSLQMSLCFFPVSNFRTGLIVKHIAYLFRKLKKNEQALELMKIAEDIYSQDPDTPEIHKIRLKISYGNIYREMKRMDQAIEYLEQCILDCKDNELYDFDRATALNCLGFVYGTMGREKLSNDNNSESGILDSYKSIDLRTAALELRNKIHKNPLNLKAALIHNNIGAVQSRLKLFDESIESYKICLAIRTDFLPKGHASIAHIKNNLATTYAKKTYFLSFDEKSANELTDAKNLCEEGFQIRIILNGEDSANLAPSYYTKGLIFLQQYRYDTNKVNDLIAARSFVQRSLVLRERWNPKLKYLIKESTDLLNEIDEEIKNHEDKQLKR